jgi:hypothetical protein
MIMCMNCSIDDYKYASSHPHFIVAVRDVVSF